MEIVITDASLQQALIVAFTVAVLALIALAYTVPSYIRLKARMAARDRIMKELHDFYVVKDTAVSLPVDFVTEMHRRCMDQVIMPDLADSLETYEIDQHDTIEFRKRAGGVELAPQKPGSGIPVDDQGWPKD